MNELLTHSGENDGPWYGGSDLLVYDATVFNSSGFTSLNGKTVLVNTSYLPGTDLPALHPTIESPFGGPCINLNYGSIFWMDTNGFQPSKMYGNWTLDYWTRETLAMVSSTDSSHFPVVMAQIPYVWSGRLFLTFGYNNYSNRVNIWSNSGSANAGSSWTIAAFRTTTWKHVVIQYNASTKTWKFWCNGVYIGDVVKEITPLPSPRYLSTLGEKAGSGGNRTLIDRYRLREGNHFSGNFDLSSLYG